MSDASERSVKLQSLIGYFALACVVFIIGYGAHSYLSWQSDRCADTAKRSGAAYYGMTKKLLEDGFGKKLEAK